MNARVLVWSRKSRQLLAQTVRDATKTSHLLKLMANAGRESAAVVLMFLFDGKRLGCNFQAK